MKKKSCLKPQDMKLKHLSYMYFNMLLHSLEMQKVLISVQNCTYFIHTEVSYLL